MESHRQEPGWMHLHLSFDEGQIKGEGVDYVGPWTIHGEFDSDSGRCHWTKSYVGKHVVLYEGRLTEAGIQGDWTIEPFLNGPFHIWPEWMTELHEKYMASLPNP